MQDSGNFKYRIVFSRRRTISISISPDNGVVVKAPYLTPAGTIKRFVNDKSEWIKKILSGFKSLKRIDNVKGYSDGDSLLLFGRDFRLKVYKSDRYSVRTGAGDTIEAGYVKDNNPLIIRAMLEGWFKYIAQEKIRQKFHEILARNSNYGFRPSDLVVRAMKKRWGSCSTKGKIAISYDLVRIDEVYTEYVVLHELCHLKHHNHGADFYRLLSEVYPDWKRVREGLKKYVR